MKVIEQGATIENALLTGQCYNCGTVIECYAKECTTNDMDGMWRDYYHPCPVCEHRITVHKRKSQGGYCGLCGRWG